MNTQRIGLIGYGEVGKIFAAGLKVKPGVESMSAWDQKFASDATRLKELDHASQVGVMTSVPPYDIRRGLQAYFTLK